ncbi:MAG: 4Fe-4S binding protein [Symbiobacteriaceae bacterium]|nr:4Fe-4S binding protein [Symbiobacteriaceae bacterium]
MKRKIIEIDAEKCNGCGLCVTACHEGAIGLVEGKAVLLREDYCDGLGDCLPVCPTGAISFREVESGIEVIAGSQEQQADHRPETLPCGCPSHHLQSLESHEENESAAVEATTPVGRVPQVSRLRQWPCQLRLVPNQAPFFQDAHLLVAADCTAFAHGNFHEEYMKNRITLVGCPKLDEADYAEKLTAILRLNSIKSLTIVRMEVPCCSGLEQAAIKALQDCGKMIPWQRVIITTDGHLKDQ